MPPLGGFPSEYRHPLWYGKTRMVSLPDGEKNFEDTFIRFDVIYERDGQTDGQTLHDSKDRAYASHRAVKRLRSTFFIEAIQTRSIARPLCDGRASCYLSPVSSRHTYSMQSVYRPKICSRVANRSCGNGAERQRSTQCTLRKVWEAAHAASHRKTHQAH